MICCGRNTDLGDRGNVVFVTTVSMWMGIAGTQTAADEVADAWRQLDPSRVQDLPGVSSAHADLADFERPDRTF